MSITPKEQNSMESKHKELQNTKFANHKICGPNGKPLPQKELDKLIMTPEEYAEKYKGKAK